MGAADTIPRRRACAASARGARQRGVAARPNLNDQGNGMTCQDQPSDRVCATLCLSVNGRRHSRRDLLLGLLVTLLLVLVVTVREPNATASRLLTRRQV
jgi:hypothetical protein